MSGPLQYSVGRGGFVPAGTLINVTNEPIGAYAPVIREMVEEPEATPKKAKAVKPKPPAPKDIVSLAKARLKEVKQELRRMKALEKECGELERLIAAAEDTKPRAVVRELKRTAG